jgi:hypothetical protein
VEAGPCGDAQQCPPGRPNSPGNLISGRKKRA